MRAVGAFEHTERRQGGSRFFGGGSIDRSVDRSRGREEESPLLLLCLRPPIGFVRFLLQTLASLAIAYIDRCPLSLSLSCSFLSACHTRALL